MPLIEKRRRKARLYVKLPALLDRPALAELKDVVLSETRAGMTIRFNSAEVDKVSTPAVQVILASAEFIAGRDARFVLPNPSEGMVEAFRDLGMQANLMSWNVD